MRVCLIGHSSASGGAGLALLETVDALSAAGIECRVVLPSRGRLSTSLRTRGIKVFVLPYVWWMGRDSPMWKRAVKLAINVLASVPLALLLRLWRVDITYTNSLTIATGAWAAWIARTPHIWHIHEFGQEHHRLTFELGQERSLRQLEHLSDACIAASQAIADRYAPHIDAARLHVIYQSVRAPAMVSVPVSPPLRCVIVGALQEQKAQDEAIAAMIQLRRRGIAAQLSIVGTGDARYEQALRMQAESGGVSDVVRFHGFVEDPFPHFENAHVALVCSRYEGFGRVTVEAMLCGRPVVAARSGANPELVRDGFNGLLYEPGDAVALADSLEFLDSRPDEAAAMGCNGHRWARERFTAERYAADLSALLQTVRSRRGPR